MPSFWNVSKLGIEDEPILNDQTSSNDTMVHDEAESAEEEKHTTSAPPVAEPFFGLKDQVAYFGFSQRGKSHIECGDPCQDRCYSAYIPENGVLITAVADGVGSCALSDLGADTAVRSSVEFIRKELQSINRGNLDTTLAGSILRNALQFAYDQVELTAKANEQLLYSLQSTLTVAIYDGRDLYFGHAGDDGIVALTDDGTLAMATTRHKGEEASSVYPLQGKSTWQFGMVQNAVAFVMATDGVLDAFVRSSFEKDRVYYPFVEPIFTAAYETEDNVKEICADLFTYMSGEEYRTAVTDDLTIVAVMNLAKVSDCLPKFDLDAWNEETRQYEEKVRSALYDQKQTLPHERNAKSSQSAPMDQSRMTIPFSQTDLFVQSAETVHASQSPEDSQSVYPHQNMCFSQQWFRSNENMSWSGEPRSPQRSSQRLGFENPYSKKRDRDFDKPTGEDTCSPCGGFYYGADAEHAKNRGETKKRKKMRPQAIIFWTLAALVLVFFVYFVIKVIRFIVSLGWLFGQFAPL